MRLLHFNYFTICGVLCGVCSMHGPLFTCETADAIQWLVVSISRRLALFTSPTAACVYRVLMFRRRTIDRFISLFFVCVRSLFASNCSPFYDAIHQINELFVSQPVWLLWLWIEKFVDLVCAERALFSLRLCTRVTTRASSVSSSVNVVIMCVWQSTPITH